MTRSGEGTLSLAREPPMRLICGRSTQPEDSPGAHYLSHATRSLCTPSAVLSTKK